MLALSVISLVAARQLVGVAAGHGHLALVDHAAYAIAAAGAGARVADEPAALFTLLESGARLAGQARVRARVRVRVRARVRARVRGLPCEIGRDGAALPRVDVDEDLRAEGW